MGESKGRRNGVKQACACIRSAFIANKHAKRRHPHPYEHVVPTKTYTHTNLYEHTERWEVQAVRLNSSFTRSEIRDLLADSESVNDITLANTSATESTALCVLCAMPFGEE